MIKLRRLEMKDIKYMLEWMNYDETKLLFKNDFSLVNEQMAKLFIQNSFTKKK